MNKRLAIYYLIVAFCGICTFVFHKKLQINNPIFLVGFNCVVEGRCPEKWADHSGEEMTIYEFRNLLQVGHQLNAKLSVSLQDDDLLLSQKFVASCDTFEISYTIKIKEDNFNLVQIDNKEKFESYIESLGRE